MLNPIFNGTITYRPWEQTAASLTAIRTVAPSFYANDVVVNTSIVGTLQQRFLKHYTFEVSGSYAITPFVGFARVEEFTGPLPAGAPAPTAIVELTREDYSRFVRVSLGSTFRQRGTISIFYSYSDYTSGLAAYALASTQVGIEIGWRY
jgi:hypothetical protein